LFVDDEAPFLEILKVLMEALSGGTWEVSTADTPSKAFGILQNQPMDLVVLDLQMGDLDGMQMLSMLNRSYPNVQKVVLTGFANEKYRAACLGNGAELFLEKPTQENGWEELFTTLNKLQRFKPAAGFRGVLRRVGMHDVLQMECTAKNSSVVEVSDGTMIGLVFVEKGQIIHAHFGDMTGADALNSLMSLAGGQVNLKPFQDPGARTISGAWESLLMEGRANPMRGRGAAIASERRQPGSACVLAGQFPRFVNRSHLQFLQRRKCCVPKWRNS
jgi:CheY-like chemotaxis protein